MWWSCRILGINKPTRRTKAPTFLADVFYADTSTKTSDHKLSFKAYGPAQCRVETVRFDGEDIADSYTHGWVFLVPPTAAPPAAPPAAAAAAAVVAPQ